jgi:hypothetical protein
VSHQHLADLIFLKKSLFHLGIVSFYSRETAVILASPFTITLENPFAYLMRRHLGFLHHPCVGFFPILGFFSGFTPLFLWNISCGNYLGKV